MKVWCPGLQPLLVIKSIRARRGLGFKKWIVYITLSHLKFIFVFQFWDIPTIYTRNFFLKQHNWKTRKKKKIICVIMCTCSGRGCVSCFELWHNFKFWRLLIFRLRTISFRAAWVIFPPNFYSSLRSPSAIQMGPATWNNTPLTSVLDLKDDRTFAVFVNLSTYLPTYLPVILLLNRNWVIVVK